MKILYAIAKQAIIIIRLFFTTFPLLPSSAGLATVTSQSDSKQHFSSLVLEKIFPLKGKKKMFVRGLTLNNTILPVKRLGKAPYYF